MAEGNPYNYGRKIYVMYHGTTVDAAYKIIKYGFKQSECGMLGRGVYLSKDPHKAKWYPKDDHEDNVVLKLTVKVGKVKKIDYQDHPLQYTWHENGYNTAWVPPNSRMVNSGLEENCVFNPRRIRVVDVFCAPPDHLEALKDLVAKHKK